MRNNYQNIDVYIKWYKDKLGKDNRPKKNNNKRKYEHKKIILPTYKDYLKSKRWKAKRKRCYDFYKGKCTKCKKHIHIKRAHIHHLHYKNFYYEKPKRDIILLCYKCHHKKHDLSNFDKEEIKEIYKDYGSIFSYIQNNT